MVREKTSGVLVMFMEPNPDAERRNNCVPVASLSRVQISLEAGSKNAGRGARAIVQRIGQLPCIWQT